MNNILQYKGFVGSIEYSDEDSIFYGKVLGIRSLISYEGEKMHDLIDDFHRAIDSYIELFSDEEKGCIDANIVIDQLKFQMEMAIKGIITKEQYAQIAEAYCSEYGYLIENTQFYKTFMGLVPDLCLYCVNEPGAADRKEKEFRDGILAVYSEMKLLQM